MASKEEMRRWIEKAYRYLLLADYYKYMDPDAHIHFYRKHFKYARKVAKAYRSGKVMEDWQPIAQQRPPREDGSAMVRILHASPDASLVDVYADGKRLARNVKFGQTTDYRALPAGSRKVDIYPAGRKGTPVASVRLSAAAGQHYTVAVVGRKARLELLTVEDRPTRRRGMAGIRFIHLSPDTPRVDLAVTGANVLFEEIGYKERTDYLFLPSATVNLEVRPTGTERAVLKIPNVKLTADAAYTVYAIGLLKGKPGLRGLVLKDG
ncbi:DUF4397 domain-containing protein [Salinithrix halophila]|uniref:DUF4397 domain-containing protein n=1 Tax=Salinithrix halophila TaxID=1485204 RepID=A0ABV8JCZ5_9BACL